MILRVGISVLMIHVMSNGLYSNLAAAQDPSKVGRGICYHTTIEGSTTRDGSCSSIQDKISKDEVAVLNYTIELRNSVLVFHETENSTKTTICQIAEAAVAASMIFDWLCVPSEATNDDVDIKHDLLLFCCDSGILSPLCYDPLHVAEVLCDVNDEFNSTKPCKMVHVADKVTVTCTKTFQLHIDVCSDPESKQDNDARLFISLSPLDAAACACAAFILVSWLIVMCVPDNKCKLAYSDDSHNTVPYRIYEIYGAVGRRGHAKIGFTAGDFDSKQPIVTEDSSSVTSSNVVHMGDSIRRQSIC